MVPPRPSGEHDEHPQSLSAVAARSFNVPIAASQRPPSKAAALPSIGGQDLTAHRQIQRDGYTGRDTRLPRLEHLVDSSAVASSTHRSDCNRKFGALALRQIIVVYGRE